MNKNNAQMEILPASLHISFAQYNCAVVTTRIKLLLSTFKQTRIKRHQKQSHSAQRPSHYQKFRGNGHW